MGIVERREREKEQRRNDIIDAAERVFFSKGRATATMDDVAEEAELSKGTLYLYFKSKEELYLAIHLRGLGILKKMFAEAVAKKETGIEKTRAVGEAYYQFYLDQPDYFNALIYFESLEQAMQEENPVANECIMEGINTLNILVEAINIGIKDGTIRPDVDPVKMAHILWGYTSGLIQLLHLKGNFLREEYHVKNDEMIQYAYDFIRIGLERKINEKNTEKDND
jgi:AcrR family transcriptional regulator